MPLDKKPGLPWRLIHTTGTYRWLLRLSWLAQQHCATLGGGRGTTRRLTNSPWLKRLVALSLGDMDYGIRMVSTYENRQ